MLNNFIIAAIPHTEPWGFNTAFVMIGANLVAVAIGRSIFASARFRQSANPATNSSIPIGTSLLTNFTVVELLASMSFGHLLGVGAVLGLTNIGVI
ncbi:photosystem I reaction center subunit PsaK [Chamaesiphon sp.]|uniref:photosystem I reaction center subunit PsaK n=1 Tax=Chamaesiphon sp. TaxID=2814140 RepID=UPI003593F697